MVINGNKTTPQVILLPTINIIMKQPFVANFIMRFKESVFWLKTSCLWPASYRSHRNTYCRNS